MSAEAALEIGRLYAPIRQIADTLSQAQADTFTQLPGLRGYWPMSVVNSSGAAVDHSNASINLLRQGSPLFSYDDNAYIQLGVGTDYLKTSLSDLDITGTEAWIASGIRGLTVGGWFKIDSTPGTTSGLISKDAPSPERGFAIHWSTTDFPTFSVSGDGLTVLNIGGTIRSLNTWYFIAGRFTPGAEIALFVNSSKITNTTSIPASVNVSTQDFEIGRFYNDNTRVIEARARDIFICASALPDDLIRQIGQSGAP